MHLPLFLIVYCKFATHRKLSLTGKSSLCKNFDMYIGVLTNESCHIGFVMVCYV